VSAQTPFPPRPDVSRDSPPPPAEGAIQDVADAQRRLRAAVRALGGGVVALSGGTDSALVLAIAASEWDAGRCVAVTSRSESLADDELADARAAARGAGVPHVVLAGAETDLEAFRRNDVDRCFHCKDSLFTAAEEVARERGLPWVVDGTNADDVADHRPGMYAARRHGVRSPLLEAGITKPWVRAVSRALGLPTWDKPAESCLSSRFPYGTPVTPEGLARVAAAERVLKDLGFRGVRVRVHDPVARVELSPSDLPAALAPGVRERIVEGIKALGFAYVALDLEGYRAGSLNEASPPPVAPPGEHAGRPVVS
jgi:uncharacterized protein